MTKLRRVALACAVSVLSLLALSLCVVHVVQLRVERRAEALLNEVRSLRLEESTAADVHSLVERYHGIQGVGGRNSGSCDRFDTSYSIRIANDALNSVGLRYSFLRFAIKPQGVVADFMLNEGRLHCMLYTFASFPPHDWKELRVEAHAYPAAPRISWPLSKPFVVDYGSGNDWVFFVNLKPGATPEELKRAFDFNLSCMGRFGGGAAACEVMPTAWKQYQEYARERGIRIPRHELEDKRCVN